MNSLHFQSKENLINTHTNIQAIWGVGLHYQGQKSGLLIYLLNKQLNFNSKQSKSEKLARL